MERRRAMDLTLDGGGETHMVAKRLAAAVDRVSADRGNGQAFSVQNQRTDWNDVVGFFWDALIRNVKLKVI